MTSAAGVAVVTVAATALGPTSCWLAYVEVEAFEATEASGLSVVANRPHAEGADLWHKKAHIHPLKPR